MGLDASVAVKVKDVGLEVGDQDFLADAKRLGLSLNDEVSLRIGSYSALHYLRDFYKMVYEDTTGSPPDEAKVHLLNHSDCDGYYLSDDFPIPAWLPTSGGGSISIGSTPRLLAELEYLKPFIEWLPPEDIATEPDSEQDFFEVAREVFDRMYLLARASMASYTPLTFH